MTLPPGTRIGPYEVLGLLGAGGMGEVYRAKDPRLGREVAVKALPADVAQHAERRARFEREAQLLASLNHPNIAAIHGLEEADSAKFLVLELVEGRTLSDLLRDAGALPVADAMAIARQIAEALGAAHEKGIIHRDLKPGNVMVTSEGRVKVLDFGLGKSLDGEARSSDPDRAPAHSPTLTMAATQAGIILGTAGYMSPEQAKGRAADRRSDVWAFGCVVYEMLTGKRAFEGEDITETLADIVRGEPDWGGLPASVPPALRTLIQRCLLKDRAQRLPDMSVVRFLLDEPSGIGALDASSTATTTASRRSIGWPAAAGLVVLAVLVTAGVMRLRSPAAAPDSAGGRVPHVSIVLPDGDEVTMLHERPLAVSPDGASVVYAGRREGKEQLYLRALDSPEPKALDGTEGAKSPFFSPDGRWIAFFAQGKLKKVTVGGTGLQVVADATDARGGCWGPDDMLYFAPTNISGILKVSAAGGTVTQLTTPDRTLGEVSHRWPHALPDGWTLLFTIWTGPGPDEQQVVRQSLATGERHQLVRGGGGAQYVLAGYLLYGRLDGLFAVPWRPEQLDLSGIVPIALPQHPRLENEGVPDFGVSTDGTLAYMAGGPERLAQHVGWVDRGGSFEGLPLPEREYEAVALSPDGRQAVVQIQDGTIGLWLYDFSRQTLTPLTTGGSSSQAPVWTHDGRHVVYRGTRKGYRNLFWKAADGTGEEERLTTKEDVVQTPTSVSTDGWLVFNESGSTTGNGTSIWMLRLDGDRTPRPLVQGDVADGRVSPDGRWIAYETFASGRREVGVQPFPGPGPLRQISIGGGESPLWSRDGSELYYQALDKFMVVDVARGPAFAAGSPRVLFEGRYRAALNGNTPYDVAQDGRRFLRIRQARPEAAATRIDVVLNWFAELRRAAAAK